MQQTEIILRQIVMLVLLGLIGFIAGKKKYLLENSGIVLSRLVINITAPILIFTTLSRYDTSSKELFDGVYLYCFGIFFIVTSFFLAKTIGNRLQLLDKTKNVFQMHFMFGN